jgi:hypothetical protein
MGGQLVNSDHADMLALVKDFGLELIDGQALGGIDQAVRDRQLSRRRPRQRAGADRGADRRGQRAARRRLGGGRARARRAVGRGLPRPPRQPDRRSRGPPPARADDPHRVRRRAGPGERARADLEPADRRRRGLRSARQQRRALRGQGRLAAVTDALAEATRTGSKPAASSSRWPGGRRRRDLRFASGDDGRGPRDPRASRRACSARSTTAGCCRPTGRPSPARCGSAPTRSSTRSIDASRGPRRRWASTARPGT